MVPRKVQVADADSLREQLAHFERHHNMPSDEFLRRWYAGQLDDRPEFFDWFGVCFLAVKIGILTQPQGQEHAEHAVG